MAIKTGRNGSVKYSTNGATSPPGTTAIASINAWKLSLKTDYEDVSCFGDLNKVYVPGLRDVSGSISGFFNGADLTLVMATAQATPGFLELIHNTTETIGSPASALGFYGPAYLDADINCQVNGAPKLEATFRAAGAWTIPGS